MIVFLTSSPGGACFEDGKEVLCELDSRNQFTRELKKVWKENTKCLMISSSPDDSKGRTFYALPDGSYLKIADGKTLLYGEAYVIKDGKLVQINKDDEVLDVSDAQDMEKLILLKRL